MTQRTKRQEGFTLTELMFSIAFISFILLFVVFAIMEVMGTYNKGLVIKDINQAARTVTEEMGRVVRDTKAQSINTSALGNRRVCLGSISYVWNIRSGTMNLYTDGTRVTMVRVEDPSGAMCAHPYPSVDQDDAIELLTNQIWVQDLQMSVNPNQKLVDFNMILSTASTNAPTGSDAVLGPVCEGGKAGNYCAVARFNTTVSTRGGDWS